MSFSESEGKEREKSTCWPIKDFKKQDNFVKVNF